MATAVNVSVECDGIAKQFGSFRLGPLSVSFRGGTTTCIVGPNGAGKTTMLSLLGGLMQPDAGQVRFVGEGSGTVDGPDRRRIGWVGDGFEDIPQDLTAMEFWNLCARLRSETDGEFRPMMARAMELSAALRFDPPPTLIRTYSHGMARKTQIVGALLHDPNVLIMDEVRNGLDAIAIRLVEEIIHQAGQRGRVIVMATHDLHYAERQADTVVAIAGGALLGVGAPTDLSGKQSLEDWFIDRVVR